MLLPVRPSTHRNSLCYGVRFTYSVAIIGTALAAGLVAGHGLAPGLFVMAAGVCVGADMLARSRLDRDARQPGHDTTGQTEEAAPTPAVAAVDGMHACGGPDIATLYFIAPDSLKSWYASFVALAPGDDVIFTGEGPDLPIAPLLEKLGGWTAVFLSSHATLARDAAVADGLRERGHQVVVQSNRCAALGADKVAMKAFFDACGFASPAWTRASGGYLSGSPEHPLVVKNRWGTQSVGIRLESRGEFRLEPDEFCEDYLDGVEYSVVVYRDQNGCAVFPPIWKGPTSPALVPPWRRLRLCPFPGLPADVESELRRTGRRVAEAADCSGLMEVELLFTDAGAVHVLEINPRVAGTLRISGMATGIPIFALHKRPQLRGNLTASHFAAEIPYSGEPYSDPQNNVYASSRLTVAAAGLADLQDRLRDFDEVAADRLARLQPARASVPGTATPTRAGCDTPPKSLPYKLFGGAQ